MNKLDKSTYRALSFLADYTRAEIKVLKEKTTGDYEKFVPNTEGNPIEQTLESFGYIKLHKNTRWMITQEGLQQLRELEQIRHRDLIVWLSGLALGISILSFAISQGWLKI